MEIVGVNCGEVSVMDYMGNGVESRWNCGKCWWRNGVFY
jgi:ribosomal protein S27AE